jgi:carboxypeptidase T
MNTGKIIGIFLVSLMLLPIAIFPSHTAGSNIILEENSHPQFSSSQHVLVQVKLSPEDDPLPQTWEIYGGNGDGWVHVVLPESDLAQLKQRDLDYSVLLWNIEQHSQSVQSQYHTLVEMKAILDGIVTDHPDIARLFSIGTTYEDRDIWCLELSDNPGQDEDEPGVLFLGLHHAREWPSLEICLLLAEKLTSDYTSNATITDLVNNRRIWIVPCVNPDGYYFCHDALIPHDWRKNRQYFPEYGTYGVDLNRNYAGSCNGDPSGEWGSVGDASVTHYPSYETYCGPMPFSEAETQAIRNFVINTELSACITYHTFGELVLWPWGYSDSVLPPDSTAMSEIGHGIAERITNQQGTGTYRPMKASGLYPTTGDTVDWMYGYSHYVQGTTIFPYTIEACSSFQPSESSLQQVCEENVDGALYLLQETARIQDISIPRVLPPSIAHLPADQDGDYTISWEVKNPASDPLYFQLDELTGLSLLSDNGEGDTSLWTLNGFRQDSTRAHSASHSYAIPLSKKDISSMTSVFPLPVSIGTKLSFWCWYDLRDLWHYAFVELSTDGRNYEILDTFTGSSNGWTQKEYSLDDYVGESVFIRFRSTTDFNDVKGGFYVDDITPVSYFTSITTIDDAIQGTHYEIEGGQEGVFYYRVRGYNDLLGWGDFSTLKKQLVKFGDNQPPSLPTLDGPSEGKSGESYTYTVSMEDADGDELQIYLDWGDGTTTGWLGPYNSGTELNFNHTFSEQGSYTIKVKSKDIFDEESDWATLEVTMPKTRSFIQDILRNLIAHPILSHLLFNFLKL